MSKTNNDPTNTMVHEILCIDKEVDRALREVVKLLERRHEKIMALAEVAPGVVLAGLPVRVSYAMACHGLTRYAAPLPVTPTLLGAQLALVKPLAEGDSEALSRWL